MFTCREYWRRLDTSEILLFKTYEVYDSLFIQEFFCKLVDIIIVTLDTEVYFNFHLYSSISFLIMYIYTVYIYPLVFNV